MKEQPALLINIDVYYLNFDSKLSQKLGVDVLFKTTNYMSLCSLLYRLYITAQDVQLATTVCRECCVTLYMQSSSIRAISQPITGGLAMLMYRCVWVRLPVFAYSQSDDTHLTLINCLCGLTGLHLCHSEVYFRSRSGDYAHLLHITSKHMALLTVNIGITGFGMAHQVFVFSLIHPLPH